MKPSRPASLEAYGSRFRKWCLGLRPWVVYTIPCRGLLDAANAFNDNFVHFCAPMLGDICLKMSFDGFD